MATQPEIEALCREIDAKQKQLAEMLKEDPPREVEDYAFVGKDDAEVRLSDLFGEKEDLVLVHNMGAACPYCTLWADGFNGVVPHLEDRAGFVVVSPDEPAKQASFAASRHWTFRMVSDAEQRFTKDMGFLGEHDGKAMVMPGFSTFRRRSDGSIVRIGHSFFGPGDLYSGIWHLFAMLDGGAGDWQPRFTYGS